jgi:type VI secretion system secreted protein VgrG
MEIATPLGEDVLLFRAMHAREEMSRLSEYRLDLLSTSGDIDMDEILGKGVTVKLALPDDSTRYFSGCVTRIAQQGMYGRHHRYLAIVRPWLWFLTRTADCRIFQDLTVPDIITAVFADHAAADYKFELTNPYRKWTYCVQYRESDFNFVSRLMEHEGIYYYFKHEDGRNTLVLTDSYSGHSPFAGYEQIPFIPPGSLARPEVEHVSSWEFAREIQPGVYVHDDYDLERPKVELRAQKALIRNHTASDYEIYDFPGQYLQKSDGEQYASVRLDELGSQFEAVNASSNARGLCVGHLVTLDGHLRADQNREHLILATNYDLELGDYESMSGGSGASCRCSFVAMSSQQQFRPARTTPRPFMQGPQTAVVVGPSGDEIYTDKHARVKVQFHWDRYGNRDENSSCWIRVSQPWAGKGWGSVSIPRIGQEVIVDFLEGDPDQPIITGRVYNGENMPPYPLPAGGVVSGLKTSTHKGKGYNEMSMNDTSGKEKITIHAQYDMNTTVEHDQTNTVNNDFTETIKKNATISITEGKYSHDVQAGTATYHVKGAVTENYDATQATTVKGEVTIRSTGGAICISADAQHVYINAATSIQLHVGSSMIWMDSGGQINIQGVNVALNGSASVTIKGGVVHSEAQSEHQTKGAIVLSEGSATNTVKGGMVMLNP